jgi:hypothetical protein
MNIDMTTITDEAATRVWDELNGGAAAPFAEQDDMIKYSVRAKVLPVVLTVIPVVQEAVETSIKEKMIATINEAHEAGHDPEFTLMALMAQLSDD